MTQSGFATLLEYIQAEERDVREDGQKEYAHEEDNAFRNFENIADQLGLDRKMVLWVYCQKHLDGIVAYINGHRSQREDVRGRIKDARMYLALLWGMIEEGTSSPRYSGEDGNSVDSWSSRPVEGGKILDDDTGEALPDTPENRAQQFGKALASTREDAKAFARD